jgi:hypothetical protein
MNSHKSRITRPKTHRRTRQCTECQSRNRVNCRVPNPELTQTSPAKCKLHSINMCQIRNVKSFVPYEPPPHFHSGWTFRVFGFANGVKDALSPTTPPSRRTTVGSSPAQSATTRSAGDVARRSWDMAKTVIAVAVILSRLQLSRIPRLCRPMGRK